MGVLTAVLLVSAAAADRAVATHRDAWRALDGVRLRAHTEHAVHTALATWNRGSAAALATGTADTVHQVADSTGTVTVTRTRTRANEFILEARATHPRLHRDGTTHWRLVRPVRISWPAFAVPAALTTLGALTVEEGAAISGADSVADGWGTECTGDTRALEIGGVVAHHLSMTQSAALTGAPPNAVPTAEQAAYAAAAFDAAVGALRHAATTVWTDSVLSLTAAELQTSPCASMLGDGSRQTPMTSCQRHWPIVAVTPLAGVRLTGSAPAQGVLIVDGDLTLDAGVRFNGVIVVTGYVTAALAAHAPETRVTGALLVRDRNAHGSKLSGPVRVRANQCAVRRALAAAGVPLLTRAAAWWEP